MAYPCALQKEDLLRMERIMLDGLGWRVKTPTSYTFLHLYTQALSCPQPKATALAAYLVELSMLDYEGLAFPPSMVAASALMLAQSWTTIVPSCEDVEFLSGKLLTMLMVGPSPHAGSMGIICWVTPDDAL